ncbi:MAG: OmpH family outer membrane protein [Gemmatimonadales bacterium]|nr:MAG: OmpH family outer membrane protein [Gemmatimonadales bacterium]
MKVLAFAFAGLLLLAGTSPADAQDLRIGYIDSQVILQAAPGAQEAQEAFDRQMEQYREEIQRRGNELDDLVEQYQQQRSTLSPEAREARENEIRTREIQYQQRLEEMEQEAAQRQQELVEPILERMAEAIDDIRAEGNYTMIFDTASRAIIAADPALDLTDRVLQRLQAMADAEDGEDS